MKPYSLLLSDHMHESEEGKDKSDWLELEEPSASKDSAGGEGSIPLLIGNLSSGVVVDLKVVI